MTSTPEDRRRRAEEAAAKAELQREAEARRIHEENERLRQLTARTARLRALRLAREAENVRPSKR